MSRFRPSGMALLAAIFIVAGLGLMLAALRIEADRRPNLDAAAGQDVVVPTTAAARATAVAVPPPSEERATELFTRAQSAERSVAYTGVKKVTRYVNGKPTVTTATVAHIPGHGTLVAPGEVDEVDPSATLTAEPADADESAMMRVLVTNYQLRTGATEDHLDREARILEAYRPDSSVAARFWIDVETGLVLRRDLLAVDGTTSERTEYVRLSLGGADGTAVPTPTSGPTAWSPVEDVASLRAEGWTVPDALEDGLALFQVREQGAGEERIVQLGYTDGLMAVSVFLQRGVLEREAMTGFVPVEVAGGEVWIRNGSLFYTWQRDPGASAAPGGAAASEAADGAEGSPASGTTEPLVVSTLSDNPRAPIGAVLAAFPPAAADEAGVGDHVTRGVKRIGRWIDPLG